MSVFRYRHGRACEGQACPAARTEISATVTAGTLSNPGFGDHNGAPQIAARVAARPLPGLLVGVSGARGAFVAQEVRDVLPTGAANHQYRQRAFGADVEVSHGSLAGALRSW